MMPADASTINHAPVITWAAPAAEVPSPDFTVTANGTPVFVYQTPVRADILRNDGMWTHSPGYASERASFALFDQSGPVKIQVKPTKPFTTAAIRPERLAIPVAVKDGLIEFTLDKPRKVTVLLDGDDRSALHLLAGEPETDIPSPKDPNVLYYGPGVHETTGLNLKSGQTLYLAGGAILRLRLKPGQEGTYNEKWKIKNHNGVGVMTRDAERVKVRGRGIIDGSLVPHIGYNTIRFTESSQVRVEGITLTNASNWNMVIHNSDNVEVRDLRIISGRLNSDGINSVNSRKIRIHDCFVRNHDDSIAVKTSLPDPKAPSEDILVENCTIWNDWGYAIGVTYETRAPIHNVTFRNIDIIHANHWCMGVHLSDSATVQNIRFEQIHVSDLSRVKHPEGSARAALSKQPLLMKMSIATDMFGHDSERGKIRDVTVENVTVYGPTMLPSSLHGAYDANDIRGVTFRNIRLLGQPPVTDANGLQLKANEFVRDLKIVGE